LGRPGRFPDANDATEVSNRDGEDGSKARIVVIVLNGSQRLSLQFNLAGVAGTCCRRLRLVCADGAVRGTTYPVGRSHAGQGCRGATLAPRRVRVVATRPA
jgi:hypothetical protein